MRAAAFIVSLCFVLGLYIPTSQAGIPKYAGLSGILYVALFGTLIVHPRITLKTSSVVLLSFIPAWVFFCSFLSGFTTFAYKATIPAYFFMALALMLRLKNVTLGRWASSLFAVVNCINIALGIGMIVGVTSVNQFIINHYSYIDPDFVADRMVALHKPVLTFYTHSIGGMMLYLLMYCSLRTFQITRKRIFLFFSIAYVCFIAALMSTTGLILCLIGSVHILYVLWSTRERFVLICLAVCVLSGPALLGTSWHDISDATKVVTSRTDSGLSGRYTRDSTMYADLQYLREHPLRPIGASTRAELLIGDSGPLEYLLRGSLPLLILVYSGYFLFLRENLLAPMDALYIFVVTLMFELAAALMLYPRFLWMLPFLCCYLNSLQRRSNVAAQAGRPLIPVLECHK